jgi:NTE family protein
VSTGRKRVGLALGGGAARGLAHIGVLQVLERERVVPDCIAGTSVGSLVGAAYAAGVRGKGLEKMALEMRWRKIARPALSRYGLASFAKLETWIVDTVGDLSFADLEIPFAAVAADLETGQPVILREGRLAPAVRASCSVPGFVIPLELDGRLLTDGGVANNLPISVAREMGADVVIAVDLMLPLGRRPKGLLEIGISSIRYLIARAGDDPATAEVHIGIPLWGIGSLVRISAGSWLIALGRQAAEEALPAIQTVLAG